MNVLFSSLHFAKIIKALLYPKNFLKGILSYQVIKKVAWRNGLMVGNF